MARELGAFARVEREVERLAIVAIVGGLVRVLQRVDGGGELFACVLVAAGGARRIDGALGLLHLLLGRVATRPRRSAEADEQDQRSGPGATHDF